MRKRNLLALIVAGIALVSCGSENAKTEQTTAAQTVEQAKNIEWTQVPNDTLVMNPITKFRDDWMLLSSGCDTNYNSMTIAWGSIGELWGRNVVNVYVSASRYTYEFMERNEYFTVTAFPEDAKPCLQYMGSHSGRDIKDKAKEAGLTVEFTKLGNPVFKEANLAIECRLLYKAELDTTNLDSDIRQRYYNGRNLPHHMYVGEIVNVYEK